jgi:hypothetical protein
MKRFVEGEDRTQNTLLAECLDDYVAADNPVPVIDVRVDELDLHELGFVRAEPATTGRPILPWGTAEDRPLWLPESHPIKPPPGTRGAAKRRADVADWSPIPGLHKTIADFRRDNAAGIRNVCRRFVLMCRRLKLLPGPSWRSLKAHEGLLILSSNLFSIAWSGLVGMVCSLWPAW